MAQQNERFINFLFPATGSRLRERMAEVSTIKSLKRLATAVAVMVACAVIGGVVISVLAVREFRAIDQNWEKYDATNAAKGVLLSHIRGHFGYGGFIHNFKDYVFKENPDLEGVVKTDLDQLKSTIANYEIVGVTEKEVAAVRGLRSVIADYERRFNQVAAGVYSGLGPIETDRLVSIDDRRALSALSTLEIVWLEARDAETKALNQHVRVGKALITGEGVFILFLGAFLAAMVWFLRRVVREIETRTVALEAEIAERGAAEHRLYVAKEETEAANWTKANLLANMGHDLRTPLNAIIGFTGAMREGIFGSIEQDKYNEYLTDIDESARRLDAFIGDVMELSIIDSGELRLDPQPLDIELLISSCVAVLRERAGQAGITISILMIDDMPALHADEGCVKKIVNHLLLSALQFTERGGRIKVVGSLTPGGRLQLEVIDKGAGMSWREIEEALRDFGDGLSAVTTRGGGHGARIGLKLAKKLMEAHQGTLEISSQPGVGTTVRAVFPANLVGA